MADPLEERMLALMEEANNLLRECRGAIQQAHNGINLLWAEWTRIHPTGGEHLRGTRTGRMKASEPNLSQPPTEPVRKVVRRSPQ